VEGGKTHIHGGRDRNCTLSQMGAVDLSRNRRMRCSVRDINSKRVE